MAKNRKTDGSESRFAPAIKTFLICLLIGGAGVGYVNQKNDIYLLSDEMRKQEMRLEGIERDRASLRRRLGAAMSGPGLEAQVKRMGLGLAPATPDQVIHLVDVPASASVGSGKTLYAERKPGGAAP